VETEIDRILRSNGIRSYGPQNKSLYTSGGSSLFPAPADIGGLERGSLERDKGKLI
jgi:hypothetical protein